MFSSYKNYYIFPTKSQLVFIDAENQEKFWTHEIDFNATPVSEKPKKYLKYDESEIENVEKVSEKQIDLFAVSSEELGLLVLTTNDKLIHLFKIEDVGLKLLSVRKFYRNPTQLVFSEQLKKLFFADKGGECFSFSLENVEMPGQWIFGHMSQILNLILSQDQKFLVSCDRDEKIRVSEIEDVPEIHSICLGHKEFVSCLRFLSSPTEQFLVSLSGDKTLRVWDFKKGTQLQVIEFDYVGMSINSIESDSNFLAIKSEKNSVFIYKYNFNEDNELELNFLTSKNYSGYTEVVSKSGKFLIATANEKSQILLEKVSPSKENLKFESIFNVNEVTKMEILTRDLDISFLFKKKFENQDEYLERKRLKVK